MADRPWFFGPDSYLSQMNPTRAMPGLSEIVSGAASAATGGTYAEGVDRLQRENAAFREEAPAAASMRDLAGFFALGGRNARPIAYPALPAPAAAPAVAAGTVPSGAMGTALVPQSTGGALVPFNRWATGGTAAATAATPFALDAFFPRDAAPSKNDGWTPPDQIANLPTSTDLKALMIRPVGGEAPTAAPVSAPIETRGRIIRNYLSDRAPTVTEYINGVAQPTRAEQLAALKAQADINNTMAQAAERSATAVKNARLPEMERIRGAAFNKITGDYRASYAAAKTDKQREELTANYTNQLFRMLTPQQLQAIIAGSMTD